MGKILTNKATDQRGIAAKFFMMRIGYAGLFESWLPKKAIRIGEIRVDWWCFADSKPNAR